MDPQIVSLVSACTALIASIAGPLATLRVSRRQFNATVLSTGRQKWIESLRDLLADLMSRRAGLSVIKGGWAGEWSGGWVCSTRTRLWLPRSSAWSWSGGRFG